MTEFYELFESVEADFKRKGIPVERPGFYDHVNFIEMERRRPQYLNNYARYVQLRSYSNEYVERAKKEIPIIANELYMELVRDGRQGACVDMSGVLSRIMEREGYWNFAVKGSLTITYPKSSGIGKRYFWSVDEGEFVAGHAWVYAPPFDVVDITVKQQPHEVGESKWLPDRVLATNAALAEPTVYDILSPVVRGYLLSHGVPESHQLEAVNPTMVRFLEAFNTYQILEHQTSLKICACGSRRAPDCPLEEMVGISIEGMSAMQMYEDLVLPTLNKNRVKQITCTRTSKSAAPSSQHFLIPVM